MAHREHQGWGLAGHSREFSASRGPRQLGCHRVNNSVGCGCGLWGHTEAARRLCGGGPWAAGTGGSGVRPTIDPCMWRGNLREMRGTLCPRAVGTSFRSATGSAAAPLRICTSIRLGVLSDYLDPRSRVNCVFKLNGRFLSQIGPCFGRRSPLRPTSDPSSTSCGYLSIIPHP